ncbi:MAG: tRNA dihydrouridine synthase DusB [Halanaerobiales bacterium]|nr:tRNA dihydrouridine synthase DusB [Halanaerobiales bacterium]
MKINNKEIEPPIFVAPMAGVTDYPYRQVLREMGAKLIYSEMVSSKGLVYGNSKTKELLDYKIKDDGYINIQLFGEETEFIVKALKIVEKEYNPDFIDLNMGCPAPKVVKTGAGSALMKKPEKVKEILTEMVEIADIPITLKIRSGWDKNSINAVEIAKIAEKAGVSLIAVHGRTREQYYSGNVDYEIIKKVKDAVNIPVIGNGDIYDISSAEKMFNKTNCDGIMVARGIQGNPWLIKRLKKYFQESIILDKPNVEQKIDMAIKHLKTAVGYYGEKVAIPKMRKHISWYLKGMKNSSYVKDKINKLTNKKEIIDTLNEYKNMLN